jgi:AhpC/TSA family
VSFYFAPSSGEPLLKLWLQAGCNKQACHFRDSTAEFTKLGYTVYGLTADTPAALAKWQTKNNFGYSLLSDPKRDFIKALGAKSTTSSKRSHFVFEKGTGKLLDVKLGVKPDDRFVLSVPFRILSDLFLATPLLSLSSNPSKTTNKLYMNEDYSRQLFKNRSIASYVRSIHLPLQLGGNRNLRGAPFSAFVTLLCPRNPMVTIRLL